jgi:superfamily I DNA and RNA helicase
MQARTMTLLKQMNISSPTSDEEAPYHDDFKGQSLKKLSAYYFPNNKSLICFSDDDDLSKQNTTQVPVASNVSDLKVYVYTDSKVSELSSSCNAKINALEVKMENTKSEYEKNLIQHKSTSEATST